VKLESPTELTAAVTDLPVLKFGLETENVVLFLMALPTELFTPFNAWALMV
jgi:hypothetical protein